MIYAQEILLLLLKENSSLPPKLGNASTSTSFANELL